MKRARQSSKKTRRLTAPARLRGPAHTHRHAPQAPWIIFWLLLIGMLH